MQKASYMQAKLIADTIIACRNKIGHPLDRLRHIADVIEEAGQHECGHESEKQAHLAGDELILADAGDQQPDAEHDQQVECGNRQQNEDCPANRNSEHVAREQKRERESDDCQCKIIQRLCQQDFPAPDRRYEQGFECAAFVFPRHDEGGQLGSDDGHDQHYDARNEVIAAVVGVVEPDARRKRDGAESCAVPFFGKVELDHIFHIRAHQPRLIRIDSVDRKIQRDVSFIELMGEIRGKIQNCFRFMTDHVFFRLARSPHDGGPEIA